MNAVILAALGVPLWFLACAVTRRFIYFVGVCGGRWVRGEGNAGKGREEGLVVPNSLPLALVYGGGPWPTYQVDETRRANP